MHNLAAVLEKDTHKLPWDLDIETDHLISARRPDRMIINQKLKKKHAKFWTLLSRLTTDIKLKESEKNDKYLDLARELKNLRNINVKIIPIVIVAFSTITKGY